MKSLIFAVAMLLSAPCWAGDAELIIHETHYCFDPSGPKFVLSDRELIGWLGETKGRMAVRDRHKEIAPYETRIVPEAELERYLNEGWEKVDVYTIYIQVKPNVPDAGVEPINKAIIRREKL